MSDPRHGRILVIGHACVDVVTVLERRPGDDEKVLAEKVWCGGGGPAANAAVALRRLGHEVVLACALGDDVLGRIAREGLEAEGVELLAPVGEGTTAVAQIQATRSGRAVVWKPGTVAELRVDAERARRWLDGIDLLYVDGHQIAAATVLVAEAKRRSLPVIGDLGTLRDGVREWLAAMTWAVASPRFARALAESDDRAVQLDALALHAPRALAVGVSAGAQGGWARRDGDTLRWRARKVGAVDTTAAGDAFHAGLADALLQGMDVPTSLEWAATLGASVCRGPGGRAFLPVDRADLQRFFARWPHRPESAQDGIATM